jgi:CubicO group peptidase (beta-lactamase class C family)
VFCLLVGLLAMVPARDGAAETTPDWSELEKTVREEMAATGTPGAAMAVIRDGRVVFSRGFGVANVETGEPVRPETLFRLASVTKMFTAATALTLVDQGKLKLDAPVSEKVPGLAKQVGKPTLHQLLSHTAGFFDGGEMDGPHDDAALAAAARSWKDDLAFIPPGRVFSYSNFGYVLAGVAAEEAAGKPFADAVKSLVLKPLGMERSTFRPTETVTYPFAQGHHPNQEQKPELVRPYLDHSGTWPAGCLNSSVVELSRFATAFLDGGKLDGQQVLSPTVIRQMSTPYAAIPSGESGDRYCYGLVVSRFQGTSMLVHGGARVGFGSDLRLFPQQRAAVIVLNNRSGFTLHRSANRACELLGLGGGEAAAPAPASAPQRTEAQLSAYTGTFVHEPMTSEIAVKDGKLWLREDGEELELKPSGPHRFKARDHGMYWLTFVMGADGKAEFIHRGHRAMCRRQPAVGTATGE